MSKRRNAPLRRLSGAIALAAAVAGCAGRGNPILSGAPASIVHEAADRTIAAGSARAAVTIGIARGPGIAGSGPVDFQGPRADLMFQRTGAGARTGDHYELIVDGDRGYLAGVGQRWLGGPLPAIADTARTQIAPLDGLLLRPGAGLAVAMLRGATAVLPYGGQEVEGISTLRYSFVIDLRAAMAASPPGERAALAAADAAIGHITFPGDVWLDAAGRIRRLQFAADPKARTTTTRPGLFLEDEGEYLSFLIIDFSQFGVPVTVNVPPPTTVTPA